MSREPRRVDVDVEHEPPTTKGYVDVETWAANHSPRPTDFATADRERDVRTGPRERRTENRRTPANLHRRGQNL